MRYAVYVDGFNLYYRCLRKTPFKWLDLKALLENLNLSKGHVVVIRYFTATVLNTTDDKNASERQAVYLRALRTLPEVKIHMGRFQMSTFKGEVIDDNGKATGKFACVRKPLEKGSDVSLASHLIKDALENNFDTAIVISNDSDLAPALEIVKSKLKKAVGIISPQQDFSIELAKRSSFKRKIKPAMLEKSQFPENLKDAHGKFSRPFTWSPEYIAKQLKHKK